MKLTTFKKFAGNKSNATLMKMLVYSTYSYTIGSDKMLLYMLYYLLIDIQHGIRENVG